MSELFSYARDRLPDWLEVTRLDRPVGIGLLLWPTLWALWLAADGLPDVDLLVIFVLGVILTRSAGCVVNDYADRDFDGHVQRTRSRPIPDGRVKPREALLLAAVLMALAFLLVLLTNTLTILLAVGAAGLAVLYPFTKRMTHLPQLFLGAAFSMAIPMAFAAQTGAVPEIAWLLYVANLLWTVAYDTEYAMVDRPWDLKVGIKSTAILFGEQDRLMVGVLQLAFLACLVMVGTRLELGLPWYLGVAGAAGLLGWQQWLIRDRDLDACFAAFRANNLVGLVIFAALLVDRGLSAAAR
ncbi:MAG: 4-hydroxybenzoate octaprenyltransferase [Pseudomonadales bacterium]|jgi:4-hydroxybenzoate polyprenyltransferase|nr:4-hydroxybenzoate octaprenyltransferase [Pseudomonadales bacterium]